MVKTLSPKRLNICGVIEIDENIETTLDETNLTLKSDERKIIYWLELISTALLEENMHNNEEI